MRFISTLALSVILTGCGDKTTTPDEIDAPVVDAPVVDAPVVDAPVVDAPVVDAPVVDAPVVDAPVVTPVDAPVVVPGKKPLKHDKKKALKHDKSADYEKHADGLSRLFSKTGLKYNERAEKHADIFDAKDNEELGFEMRKMFGGADEHDEGEIMRDMFGESEEAVEADVNYSVPKGLMVGNVLHNTQVREALESRASVLGAEQKATGASIDQLITVPLQRIRAAGFNRIDIANVAVDLDSYESYLSRMVPKFANGDVKPGDYPFRP